MKATGTMKNLLGSKTKFNQGTPDYGLILNLLPEEVSELVSSLEPEDSEILAYLIACPSQTRVDTHHTKSGKKGQCELPCSRPAPCKISGDSGKTQQTNSTAVKSAVQLRKPASFCCNCFQCYTSYWSRWDSSPNRAKIDEAIALYEDHIDKKSRKPAKGSNDKGEKRQEGKGRGRKFQKEQKLKDSKAFKAGKSDAHAVSKDQKPTTLPQPVPEEQVVDKQEKERPLNDTADVETRTGGIGSEKVTSSKPPPKIQNKSSQNSKEKAGLKEVKVKTSRVAPFVGEGALADQRDDKCLDVLDPETEEEDSTALHRGKRVMSFVANRLWSFWDRRVQSKVVDVY